MTQLFTEVSKLAPKLSGNLKINRKKQAVNDLVASLFNTVRMAEWEFNDDEVAYKFPLNKKLALWLTPTSVEVRKGIRVFPIGSGKDAERLFNNIKHAQAVIAKAIAEQDKQVTAFCEAFDIDAELADSSILGEALNEAKLSKNDDVVSADQTYVDIKIKPAPTSIAPAETSPESEAAADFVGGTDEREEVLSKIATAQQAIKALEVEIGAEDPEESDIFADVLGSSEAKARNDAKVYGDAGTSVVDAFTKEEDDPNTAANRAGMLAKFDRWDHKSGLKSLQGRVLGIVDASFSDKEQRAAVKTLINKEFRREMDKP
jgi:hypothetical protein